MSVDWSDLPPEIIETIAGNLRSYGEYLRFRAACRSWHSFLPKAPLRLRPQLPWLMLSRRAFFHLSTHKTHLLNLPEPSIRTRNCGSSHGWLVTLNEESPSIILLNPLTRATRSLPPLNAFPSVITFSYANVGREYLVRNHHGGVDSFNLRQMCNSFVRKIVLSSSPSRNNEFSAFAIVGERNLAFCRSRDDSWIFVSEEEELHCWEDAVHHHGSNSFYAISKGGTVAVCRVDDDCFPPRVSIVQTVAPVRFSGDIHYVVFSGENMMLVSRILEQEFDDAGGESNLVYRTVGFEIFEMNWFALKWEKVESLGDRALFIGGNSSLSLFAGCVGCLGDCIYFTDDYSDFNYDDACGKHDLGIFRLWDQGIEPLPCYPRNSYSRLGWPLPIWVSPNPS
ncbi:hypothetical protein PIB30_051390 [Stylosanthes scabra]|uniref:KIB1-4 beta-propeller domain-containing protein n=1 Tax=Stylosanthes scabra TaxID=79078 RepID=A0ABU6UH98_9FABA|nr:hypothetical protein [Stylosanthes scabra]